MLNDLKEDIEQYQILKDNFEGLNSEDVVTAYNLAIQMLICADRWSEISLNVAKYSKELSYSKTSLYNWAYHKYRIMMTMHDFCRVVYRQCKEDLRNRFDGEI